MKDTQEIRVGGYRWTINEGLTAPDIDRVRQALSARTAAVVKHAPHRAIYHVLLPGLDLHVKHYGGGFREWCRCLMRGRRAAREFALSREVAQRGVPTLEVLGCGESERRFGAAESFLVTRTLPGTCSLLDFLESSQTPETLQSIAVSIGRLLASMHQAGVRHLDLHPGNMLLRFTDGEPHLYLIDLDMVWLSRSLSWPTARDNLVMLDRWFALRFSRSDRLRAWKAYRQGRTDLTPDERQLARELADGTAASLLQVTRQLDGRCLGGNRHFRRLRGPGIKGHAVADLDAASLLADTDGVFNSPNVKLLKRSASSFVVELPEGQILKRVPAEPIASLFRKPPALRSYRIGHAFRLRGLPTPRPLAVWHRRRFGLCREGYLLVEKVSHALHLRGFVEMLAGKPARERNARLWSVLDQLGRLVRRMHEWRYSHRDLKAANILISPTGWVMGSRGLREVEAGGDHVWLIDLVGVRKFGKLGRARRLADLARLHMSFLDHPDLTRADRLRFLRSYLGWGLGGSANWKGWWVEIDRAGREKAVRTAARGRVVG